MTQTAAVTTEISNSKDDSNNMTTHNSRNAGRVYIMVSTHRDLCCFWTCLHYKGLCCTCTWTCLHHRGRSCTLTCLHCRGLPFFWRCLHYRGLSCIWTCLRYRSLCCTWTCSMTTVLFESKRTVVIEHCKSCIFLYLFCACCGKGVNTDKINYVVSRGKVLCENTF